MTSGQPIPLASRRELLADDFLIDSLSGRATLKLHAPVPRDIAVTHDRSWDFGRHSPSGQRVLRGANLHRLAPGALASIMRNSCNMLADLFAK